MLTARGNKWSNPEREKKLNDAVKGWINHFRYADMKGLVEGGDDAKFGVDQIRMYFVGIQLGGRTD